jgi:hypothetical protein
MVQRPAIREHNPKVDGKTAQHARSTAFVMHSIQTARCIRSITAFTFQPLISSNGLLLNHKDGAYQITPHLAQLFVRPFTENHTHFLIASMALLRRLFSQSCHLTSQPLIHDQRLRAGRFDLERFTKLLGHSFGFGLNHSHSHSHSHMTQ